MGLTSSQAAQLFRNTGAQVPRELEGAEEMKRHKYNASRKMIDGIVFDSASEAEAYRVLKLWERAGKIVNLGLQPIFILQEKQVIPIAHPGVRRVQRAIKYVADFSFVEVDPIMGPREHLTVVDVKGIQTPAFRIKAKLFRAKYPDIDLQVWDRNKVKELSR